MTPGSLSAQIQVSPADTGILKWGYIYDSTYSVPSMCDRAGIVYYRISQRTHRRPVTAAEILDTVEMPMMVSKEGQDFVRSCLKKFDIDTLGIADLWGYARATLHIGEDEQAIHAIERVFAKTKDSLLKEHVYMDAIHMLLNALPRRLNLVKTYTDKLDQLYPTPRSSSYAIRATMIRFWGVRYYQDSVHKYATEALDIFRRLSRSDKQSVDALLPFQSLIDLANHNGNISEQEQWLDSMNIYLSEWGGGTGATVTKRLQRAIDTRKITYNRKINSISEGLWANSDNREFPVQGRASLLIRLSHSCHSPSCTELINTLKDLQTVFGNDLEIVFVTQTEGFVLGSPPLPPEEEVIAAADYFAKTYGLDYSLLMDVRPTYTMPDGRIVRSPGPIAELFNDWAAINALLTDRDGRVQWTGTFRGAGDRRAVIKTINRILGRE